MDDLDLTIEDVEKIKDQNRLFEIVKNQDLDVRIRIKAVNDIEDKCIFADYAYDEDVFLRMYAAKYLEDDETLLDLMLNDSSDYVRCDAGRKFIHNCDSEKYVDVLVEFSLENPKYNVSPLTDTDTAARFACMRIKDTSKLLRIIKESNSLYVYGYAMRKVDKESLRQLLYSGELDIGKEVMVAEKLNDERKLTELLYGGKLDTETEIEVAMELEDDEKLSELLERPISPRNTYIPNTGEDPDNILGHTVPNIFPGDSIYLRIVFSYPNEDIAIKALNLIGFKSNLEKITQSHKNPKIRRLAKEILKHKDY